MQFTNKDIIQFNKLLQTRLPRDLKTKFFVKLYRPVSSCYNELKLAGTKSADHYITADRQPEYLRDNLNESFESIFATIQFNTKPNDKHYLIQLDGFSYFVSYDEIDAAINYTFDEARNIMTVITAFIDTAKEFFN